MTIPAMTNKAVAANKPRVNLIARDNGVGLSRDLHLLAETLQAAGYRVAVTGLRGGKLTKWLRPSLKRLQWLGRLMSGRGRRPAHDINVMLEHIWPDDLPLARHNVLVPNPEWFLPRDRRHLQRIDLVLAKTYATQAIFSAPALGVRVVYTGFVSEDRLDAAQPRQRSFFHLAGRSHSKGTERLLALWQRHPEWPLLVVMQNPRSKIPVATAGNIDHRVGYLTDDELKQMQNAHRFHLCPSETEGYGHYIVEAMSVGALTVTLDAPPMNELVSAKRGLLVAAQAATGSQQLATTYFFDEASMEAAVAQALQLDDQSLQKTGVAARAWFEENQALFARRLVAALETLS